MTVTENQWWESAAWAEPLNSKYNFKMPPPHDSTQGPFLNMFTDFQHFQTTESKVCILRANPRGHRKKRGAGQVYWSHSQVLLLVGKISKGALGGILCRGGSLKLYHSTVAFLF